MNIHLCESMPLLVIPHESMLYHSMSCVSITCEFMLCGPIHAKKNAMPCEPIPICGRNVYPAPHIFATVLRTLRSYGDGYKPNVGTLFPHPLLTSQRLYKCDANMRREIQISTPILEKGTRNGLVPMSVNNRTNFGTRPISRSDS